MIGHQTWLDYMKTSRIARFAAFRGFFLLRAGFASSHRATQGLNSSRFRVRPRGGFRRVPAALLLLLLALPAIPAQTRKDKPATQPKVVPLQSDTCPVVHGGDKIAFDWNPVFDLERAVTGIDFARLQFARLDEDGVHLQETRSLYTLGGRISPAIVTALANGFYRFELTVQSGRITTPVVYRLVDARMHARVEEDYNGPAPKMTRSPVESRFCITLQPAQ